MNSISLLIIVRGFNFGLWGHRPRRGIIVRDFNFDLWGQIDSGLWGHRPRAGTKTEEKGEGIIVRGFNFELWGQIDSGLWAHRPGVEFFRSLNLGPCPHRPKQYQSTVFINSFSNLIIDSLSSCTSTATPVTVSNTAPCRSRLFLKKRGDAAFISWFLLKLITYRLI